MLEQSNLFVGKGIGLGDNWDQVDLGVQATHDLNIERLQGVASRLDEVNTSMDTVVNNVHAVDLVLSFKVSVVSLLDVFDNRSPRVIVVDKVTKSGGINNSQAKTDSILFDISADRLDRHGLGDDIMAGSLALLGWVEGGVKQGVDQRGLSETRFTCERKRVSLASFFPRPRDRRSLGYTISFTYQQP